MTVFKLQIDSAFASHTPHTIQVFQAGALIGTAAATVTTPGKATYVSADVTLSGFSAGSVEVSSYAGSNDQLTNSEMMVIDGTGAISTGDAEVALAAIQAKTDLIGTGSAFAEAPVSEDGTIINLIIDDDYLAANGRALEWTFTGITGFTTSATGKFGLEKANDPTKTAIVTGGVVTDEGGGTWKVSFDILNTDLTALTPGEYEWSVEISEGGVLITTIKNQQNKTRVTLLAKQT